MIIKSGRNIAVILSLVPLNLPVRGVSARLGTILTEEEQCNMCSCNYGCDTLLSLKSARIYEAFIVRALTLNSLKTLFFFLSLYSQPSTFCDPSLIADSK